MANLFDADNAALIEPLAFTAGDFLQWKRVDLAEDYPPALYRLHYTARQRGGGATTFTFTATASDGVFLVQVASTVTADYVDGKYHWQAEIERISDGARIVVGTGEWDVLPDYASNNADPRQHAEIMLDKIETLLEGKADKDVASYSIAGRSITKMTISELLQWRGYYKSEVAKLSREARVRAGRPSNATVKVRFV